MRHRTHGFSLVELLVVIGIIAVLIAFLLPALQRARDSAGTVACLAQERSIGQSFVMYNNDWHNRYPIIWYWQPASGPTGTSAYFAHYFVGGASNFWTWKDAIFPYQNSLRGWQCPRQQYLDTTIGGVKYTIAGYTMNASAGGGGAPWDRGDPDYVFEEAYQYDQWVNDARVKNRTEKVLIGCASQGIRADGALCAGFALGSFSADPPAWAIYEQYNTYPATMLVRWGQHRAGCPVIFIDQHGDVLGPSQNFCSMTGDSDKWLNVYK